MTIYLDVDQSRQSNLNRGFENQLNDMLVSIRNLICDDDEMQLFETASKQVLEFVHAYNIRARGLVMVADARDGFFWNSNVDFPISNQIRWDKEVFVQPLAIAIDEYEAVGIVLLDRANVRFFTMFLGRAQERTWKKFDRKKVHHTKTVGTDHLGSASRAQRSADEQVRMNLRYVVTDVDRMFAQHGVERIILAGSAEITAELKSLLPKRLKSQIIGYIDLPLSATIEQIQNTATPVAEQFERKTEEDLVTDFVTSAAKSKSAVIGLARTLYVLNQRRAWLLLYVDGLHSRGNECAKCGALYSAEISSCSACGGRVAGVANVVERAVDLALRTGVKVEVIRNEEQESVLLNAGGIGAFLKTRTASA
jgi:peptide subunit release factor 1 (eRF1)